ncbi:6-hydroxymethylpterin diphosphokinase MptE-like protein [Sphaerothrix gracilis]|uniref:6-hydroxymethylpterin diphosphokinase MptE-like protein n=1 Tax=Sphaerothrix gracilis TaxID=3151835 RepID=UPI0031FCC377
MPFSVKAALKPVRDALVEYLNHFSDPVHRHWYFKEVPRLQKFKDKHKGESCFIIGNGPSLNRMDLSLLKNHHTFGLNKIYLMFDKVDLDINYHVSVNSLVIQQSTKEFESLTCPSFLSVRASHNIVCSKQNIYKIMTGVPMSFQEDISKTVCEGYTVTYVAMQIAFYMGFRNIFLIGVDHNFAVKGKPNEQQFLKQDDPNHFSPDYFKGSQWNLPDLEASELSYRLAKFYFERDDRLIYDATLDGKLKVFPKISYEAALEKCKL